MASLAISKIELLKFTFVPTEPLDPTQEKLLIPAGIGLKTLTFTAFKGPLFFTFKV